MGFPVGSSRTTSIWCGFSQRIQLAREQVLDTSSLQVVSSSNVNHLPCFKALMNTPEKYIAAQYPGVTNHIPKPSCKPAHGVYHHIETAGPQIFAKARRLDPDKLAAAKAEISKMEAEQIVRRSNSPWASPHHMVKKTDGSWRPGGDYYWLNTITCPDRYPFPNMQDLTSISFTWMYCIQ